MTTIIKTAAVLPTVNLTVLYIDTKLIYILVNIQIFNVFIIVINTLIKRLLLRFFSLWEHSPQRKIILPCTYQ